MSCLFDFEESNLEIFMVTSRVDEISQIIRKRIEQYNTEVKIVNTGTVLQVGDGIARIYGLDDVMAGTDGARTRSFRLDRAVL